MTAADFWTRPDRHATLARLALMDRVKAAAATASSLRDRLAKGTERTGKHSRELVGRLALQLHLLKEGIRDVMEARPDRGGARGRAGVREAERATRRRGAGAGSCSTCTAAGRTTGTCSSQRSPAGTQRDLPWLLISGFGAHRLLAQEIGLHVLELADEARAPRRAAARVRLAVAPLGDLPADKLRSRAGRGAWRAGPQPHAVVRRYRSEPSPLVRNMNGSWRTGKLDAVLRGDFDLIAASLA